MNRMNKIVNPSVDEINTIEIEANSLKDMANEITSLNSQIDILKDENETLFETNNALIKEIRDSKDKYNELYEEYLLRINECDHLYGELQEAKQEIRRLKNPRSCGMCITCIECKQAISDEELAMEQSIADAEAYYHKTWNLACGDDF